MSLASSWNSVSQSRDEEEYNYSLGWSSSAQPVESLEGHEYLKLAAQGVEAFRQDLTDYCRRQHLKFIEIPHSDYRIQFEKGKQRFNDWLKDYCQHNGLPQNADIAIVGPCVKDENSSDFKTSARSPDRVRDYLRAMVIVLEGSSKKTTPKSLNTMGNIIADLDFFDGFGTVARKNYFFKPKENGYRAYKSGWIVSIPGGLGMFAELKIEHAAQQDANRMTRRFMGISRQARDAMEGFYPRCSSLGSNDSRNTHHNCARLQQRINDLDAFSKAVYATIHDKAGLNRFLSPQERNNHIPRNTAIMQQLAGKAIEAFPRVADEIKNAGYGEFIKASSFFRLERMFG